MVHITDVEELIHGQTLRMGNWPFSRRRVRSQLISPAFFRRQQVGRAGLWPESTKRTKKYLTPDVVALQALEVYE